MTMTHERKVELVKISAFIITTMVLIIMMIDVLDIKEVIWMCKP